MTAGFFTSEVLPWEYYELSKDMPVYDYAPDVELMGSICIFTHVQGENMLSLQVKRSDQRTV